MQANIIYQVYDSQRRQERREQRERDRRLSLLAATVRRRWRRVGSSAPDGGATPPLPSVWSPPLGRGHTPESSARQDSEVDQGGH